MTIESVIIGADNEPIWEMRLFLPRPLLTLPTASAVIVSLCPWARPFHRRPLCLAGGGGSILCCPPPASHHDMLVYGAPSLAGLARGGGVRSCAAVDESLVTFVGLCDARAPFCLKGLSGAAKTPRQAAMPLSFGNSAHCGSPGTGASSSAMRCSSIAARPAQFAPTYSS